MQRKATKRNTPRSLRPARESRAGCPVLLGKAAREPNSPSEQGQLASGSNTVSRIPVAFPVVLGLLYGDYFNRNNNYSGNRKPMKDSVAVVAVVVRIPVERASSTAGFGQKPEGGAGREPAPNSQYRDVP